MNHIIGLLEREARRIAYQRSADSFQLPFTMVYSRVYPLTLLAGAVVMALLTGIMVFSDCLDLAWLSGALGIVALILVLYFCTARIRVDETGITKRVLFVFREFIPWDKIRAAKLWRFGSLFDDNNASAREVPWEKDAVLILYADTKVILDVSPIYTDFEHLVTAVSRKGIRVECKNNARPATKDYFRLR